jgi:hypothetical protein
MEVSVPDNDLFDTGRPTQKTARVLQGLRTRLFSRAIINPDSGCWEWTGSKDHGYGSIHFRGKMIRAHRAAWRLWFGLIPNGLELDHLCRNRACVNPAHLEPVSHRENTLRGTAPVSENAAKTHCSNGHEFTPENTGRNKDGSRYCKSCLRERSSARRRREAEREGRALLPPPAERTHCKNGHEYTPANTYRLPDGRRDCRTCIRARLKKSQGAKAS